MAAPSQNAHPREQLLKIERKIFRQNERTIQDATEVTDPQFQRYLSHYLASVKSYSRAATPDEVQREIASSRIVLVGDYHTLDQSQRSFVRLLRSYFRKRDKNVIVALETVPAQYQKELDRFMDQKMTAAEFIKKIGFKKHWFFDLWGNYEVIFDFLRYHGIPVFAIEAARHEKKTLKERDVFMARRIAALAQKYPDRKIFVLVGDLHLAPRHLPAQIKKQAKKKKLKLPIVTLYQNSAQIYWKLSEKDLVDHTLIVKVADKAYCRMHTPPIIQQQSYLNWLYHEEGGFDWIDARSSFLSLVQRIASVIDMPLPPDWENVEVYTCGDLGFMRLLSRKREFTKKELEFIRRQIENSESYFLPAQRIVYIANVSIHHAAEEASHYLKTLLTGLEFARSQRDAFYANVLHEAIGFFGSKLINSKRKCARYKDFLAEKTYLEHANLAARQDIAHETALLFIRHHRLVKKGKLLNTNKITHLSRELFLSLTHAIGYDLGDHLYYGFMCRKIKKEKIKDLFTNPYSKEGEPGRVYLEFVKALKGVKRPLTL